MSTSKKAQQAPKVQSPDGKELTEISVSTYRSHVEIVVSGQAGGTKVTAHFKVQENADWSYSATAVAGQPLKIELQAAAYKLHQGKTATITYTTDQGTSDALHIKIVA
ncbi:hypothetical protein [Pseudomonas helleri]|uniref:hypothetical protein n=1 Tax=Pseudomonas helleri TaxID=1608996 RepID=UPI0028E5CFC2|nr:hypothetical protein [Pseudomonas helleri]